MDYNVNPGFEHLQPYPFEKLALLIQETEVSTDLRPVDLSLGEPKHITPPFILEAITDHLAGAGKYPPIKGSPELRIVIRDWLCRRYGLSPDSLDPQDQILPVNGTREALFAVAHCFIDPGKPAPLVVTGNPFYQIYEGAALFAGAGLDYVNPGIGNPLLPDYRAVSPETWERCQLLYICSPNNPTGETLTQRDYEHLFELADRHDFIIAADECYSEIYLDENAPPLGILEAAAGAGRRAYDRIIAFHSLSKRSNVPGMRSGFIAGARSLMQQFYRYRTYHGCAMPPFIQAASIAAWTDESHVAENRRLYREKFDAVLDILAPVMEIHRPLAGFYLWPRSPGDDVVFTRRLLAERNVTVLPGSFTSRAVAGVNPGAGRIRIALVAPLADCIEAATRIRSLIDSY